MSKSIFSKCAMDPKFVGNAGSESANNEKGSATLEGPSAESSHQK